MLLPLDDVPLPILVVSEMVSVAVAAQVEFVQLLVLSLVSASPSESSYLPF